MDPTNPRPGAHGSLRLALGCHCHRGWAASVRERTNGGALMGLHSAFNSTQPINLNLKSYPLQQAAHDSPK